MSAMRARAVAATVAILLAGAAPQRAAAQCSYTALTGGISVSTSTDPSYYTFAQTANYWAAVAVRPSPGTDWDVSTYQSSAPPPACMDGYLNGSGLFTGVDVVVGDFNYGRNPLGTYYAFVSEYSGGGSAQVEWQGSSQVLNVRGPSVERALQPNHVVDVWDVFLEKNVQYSFQFFPGGTGARLLLFRNHTGGVCWKARSEAEFDVGGITTYAAPDSGWYGAVVVNDLQQAGSFRLGVGTCSAPVALNSGGPMWTALTYEYFSFTQTQPRWTAIGVRGADNWDIHVNSAPSGTTFPNCLGPTLAASQYPAGYADFVVGDFHVNPPGTYWAGAEVPGGLGSGGVIEWDDGPDTLMVGGWWVSRTTGPGDVLEVWDVWLEAGRNYTFQVAANLPNLSISLFRNPGQSPYWAGRDGAWATASWGGTGGSATFHAISTGYHALVVANDGGQSGSYSVQVTTCNPPIAMTPGTLYPAPRVWNHHSFAQTVPYWTAVGVRGAGDWDQGVYGTPDDYPPACSADWIKSSAGIGIVDFVVGDFNFNPHGTYYSLSWFGSPEFQGAIQWDSGTDQIIPNGGTIARTTDGSGVLEVWDALLSGGIPYSLRLVSGGPTEFSVHLFENPANSPWWGARNEAMFTATSPVGPQAFTPSSSGWHGVVVVNENGQPGWYTLRLDQGVVSVEGEPRPDRTELRAVAPNPVRGSAGIRFALHEPGEVAFDIHDLAGRRVAGLPPRAWNAGTWSASWDGRGDAGRRLAPGIYVVRMRIGGTVAGQRRVTLLE